MLYIARLRPKNEEERKSNNGRLLRKIKGCGSLQEASEKCKEAYPTYEIVSIQLSKRKLSAALNRQ